MFRLDVATLSDTLARLLDYVDGKSTTNTIDPDEYNSVKDVIGSMLLAMFKDTRYQRKSFQLILCQSSAAHMNCAWTLQHVLVA